MPTLRNVSHSHHRTQWAVSLGSLVLLLHCRGDASSVIVAGPPLRITDAWSRMADSAQTGGAYLTVTNTDTADVTIVGAESARANTTTLHESSEHDGMMHMMPQTSIRVPKDSTVRMTPGGLHVMLEGLTSALRAGDSLSVTLLLQDGRRIPVPVRVRNE